MICIDYNLCLLSPWGSQSFIDTLSPIHSYPSKVFGGGRNMMLKVNHP